MPQGEKRDRPRVARENRRNLRGWADGEREKILAPHLEKYTAAFDKGWVHERKYLRKVCLEYHARVDWRAGDYEEPVLTAWDPAAPVAPEKLTDDEQVIKRKRINELNARIRRWYKYRIKRTRRFTGASGLDPSKNPYAVLLGKLSNLTAPPKTRQAFQQFMRESYKAKIAPSVEEQWPAERVRLLAEGKKVGKKPNAGFRAEVARAAYAALPSEERTAISARATAEGKAAKEAYVDALKNPPPQDPASRQKCIDALGEFMGPILQGIHSYTGLHSTLIVGGPMPQFGGELRTTHISYGRNKTGLAQHWPQWDKPRFASNVQAFMIQYLKTAFTAADCAETALANADLSNAKYTIRGGNDSESDSDSDSDTESLLDLDGSDEEGRGRPRKKAKKSKKAKGKQRKSASTSSHSSSHSRSRSPLHSPSHSSSRPATPEAAAPPAHWRNNGLGMFSTQAEKDAYEEEHRQNLAATAKIKEAFRMSMAELGPFPARAPPPPRPKPKPRVKGTAPVRKSARQARAGVAEDVEMSDVEALNTSNNNGEQQDVEMADAGPSPPAGSPTSTASANASVTVVAATASLLSPATGPTPSAHSRATATSGASIIPSTSADPPATEGPCATGASAGTPVGATPLTSTSDTSTTTSTVAPAPAASAPPAASALPSAPSPPSPSSTPSVPPTPSVPSTPSGAPPSSSARGVANPNGDMVASLGAAPTPSGAPPVLAVERSTLVPCPVGAPEWFVSGRAAVTQDNLGCHFDALLAAWSRIEYASRFEHSPDNLPSKGRPTEVNAWIRGKRVGKPVLEVKKISQFEKKWSAWWASLQPDWREKDEDGNWVMGEYGEKGAEWGPMYRWGVNGTLSVLAGLYCWGCALEEGGLATAAWDDAVADATWMLEGMAVYYEKFKRKF